MPSLSYVSQHGLRIARITFFDASRPVNVLNAKTISEFEICLEEIEERLAFGEPIAGVIVRSAIPDMFIAGANIEELLRIENPEDAKALVQHVHDLFLRFERLPVPTVAAIGGACLGGGLELALACHGRIAADDGTKVTIGLPETKLGIIPGFGGTQRLPRLIGLTAAIKTITSADSFTGPEAFRAGIVDQVVPIWLLDAAAENWIRSAVRDPGSVVPVSARTSRRTRFEKTPLGPGFIRWQAKRQALRKTHGHYPAIPAAIDAIAASTKPLVEGLTVEADAFASVATGSVARNLIGIYFLTQRAKKQGGGTPKPVQTVGVVGAGVMGRGIALVALRAGYHVVLTDTAPAILTDAQTFIEQETRKRVERGRLSSRDGEALLARLSVSGDIAAHAPADVVIEAIVENLGIKQRVLADIRAANPAAIIATNTSSLNVSDIGESVVGMHFFNPAHKMPLVEVVRTETANEDDVATIVAFASRLGKTPVVVSDVPGFLVNRVLGAYFAEAGKLAAEGVPIERIDRAMERFGMPMGPFRLLDEVGLDIAASVAENLTVAYGNRMRPAFNLSLLVERGFLGKKNDHGFFFPGGKRVNRDVQSLAGLLPSRDGKELPSSIIVGRLTLAMLNELATCAKEGVLADMALADIAMVFGTGFPPFRGGPFAYAGLKILE